MRIYVWPAGFSHERLFLDTFAETCEELGHEISGNKQRADVHLRWGANRAEDVPTIHCEMGWLPRWSFQVSHTGINANHHAAGQSSLPLDEDQRWKVRCHLRDIRRNQGAPSWQYSDTLAPAVSGPPIDDGFILAPLQVESDTNMSHAPVELATNQGFIDYISEADPPWPVIFKQHPNSTAGYQLYLDTRRPEDRLLEHPEGNVHQYLKHPGCRAVVTINSNTANDALLWDVPAITLGRGIWPEHGPFLHYLLEGGQWRGLEAWHAGTVALRQAYIYHLMQIQWTLEDAKEASRVNAALQNVMP